VTPSGAWPDGSAPRGGRQVGSTSLERGNRAAASSAVSARRPGRAVKATSRGICALALAIAAFSGGVALAKGPCSTSAAGAGCKKNVAKADIQKGNDSCGVNHPELLVLGMVRFGRLGNTVNLQVQLKHGDPNTTYEVSLAGSGCSLLGTVLSFKTNSKGRGHGSGALEVPAGDIEFFADAFQPGCASGHCHNETRAVGLQP
jgi:hypothetical protein